MASGPKNIMKHYAIAITTTEVRWTEMQKGNIFPNPQAPLQAVDAAS